MQNDDQKRPGQPTIHTHLPDAIPPEDARKIVGEAVPHGADYNSPPPQGAGKSMGSGLDDVGGPAMGAPAGEGGQHGATIRDRDVRADDRHMGSMQQGGQGGGTPVAAMSQGGKGSGEQGTSQGGNQADTSSGSQFGSQSGAPSGSEQRGDVARSEGLLPGQGEDDGRYDVAEEVSLDQQSDRARNVGSMAEAAKGPHGDKLQEAVARSLGKQADDKQK
ncbi:hypothetical protein [Pseudoduganella chitinolytica]|uniref:Uncharacterized protein n=1 Tax=Pseudoduganella chitinolytica TaxID=34070 RepID=A0ABY8BHL0_9BURK|nr:hypothetical protein [Pseudoduganella chitinolytica]WEF35446.1 hypothetical protein PX653_12055 [Pseudoduganella chitinolytica]